MAGKRQGGKAMKVDNWKIGRVKRYQNNPRDNDGAVAAVVASIRQFGFLQPIVVDPNGVIIVGDTRYLASRKLKLKSVPVVVARKLSPAKVRAYRIADNHCAELAEWDPKLLKLELAELQEADFDLLPLQLDELLPASGRGGNKKKKKLDAEPQLGGLFYRVLVDCVDEAAQVALMERLRAEGYECSAMMS
jgi:ParB-like chromosome segregation protein Spo0J